MPLLALAFNPLLYYLSFTFFTDVPFLTLCIISIFCFQKYVLYKKLKYLAWAVFWAIAAFFIRQPGLLLIVAFAASILLDERFSKQALLITITLALITLGVYFSLENLVKPTLGISGNFVPVGDQFYAALLGQPLSTIIEWGKKAIKTFIYLGFFGLPFIPIYWKKITKAIFINNRFLTLIFILNAGLFALLLLTGKTFPFGGNILFNFGLGSELLADVYTLGLSNTPKLPNWIMLILQFISQLSATFLFVTILKTFKKEQRRFIIFLLILNVIYIPIMSITSFFDRYLLITIVSFFIVLSIGIGNKYKLSWNLIPLIFLAGFSILATKDFMAWNRSKSEAFQYLTEKGISITQIDAGYEYNGFYNYHYPREEKEGKSFWWVSDNKFMITFGPVEGYHVLASFPYYRCLFFKENSILVLERDN